MRTQRGIANGWLYLIAVVVLIVVCTAAFHAFTSYVERQEEQAYERGRQEVIAKYETRDHAALQKALADVQQLEQQARDKEKAHQQALDKIATQLAKEKADAKKQRESDIAGVRAGTIVLRDPGATTACAAPSGAGATGATVASGPGSGAAAGGGLSPAATEFLFNLVNDADEVVRQLDKAIDVIEEDRRTCG